MAANQTKVARRQGGSATPHQRIQSATKVWEAATQSTSQTFHRRYGRVHQNSLRLPDRKGTEVTASKKYVAQRGRLLMPSMTASMSTTRFEFLRKDGRLFPHPRFRVPYTELNSAFMMCEGGLSSIPE